MNTKYFFVANFKRLLQNFVNENLTKDLQKKKQMLYLHQMNSME